MKHAICCYTIFLLIGAFEYGHCDIKCYTCSSKENLNCLHPENNRMELKKCDSQSLEDIKKHAASIDHRFSKIYEVSLHTNSDPLIPLKCMKQVTKIGNEEYIIRGCQFGIGDKLDICNKMNETAKNERITVTHCSLCDKDGCNTATKIKSLSLNFVSVLLILCLSNI